VQTLLPVPRTGFACVAVGAREVSEANGGGRLEALAQRNPSQHGSEGPLNARLHEVAAVARAVAEA